MTATDPRAVVERLLRDQPRFHGQGTITWYATRGTLDFLARTVKPGDRTLETGSGASSVVIAAAGAEHVAISPSGLEHELIQKYCEQIEVDTARVNFVSRPSDEVLPTLELPGALDLVFIDGAHSFPFPTVDWHFARRRLRIGGLLVLDDVPIPAVGVVFRAMKGDPAWEFVEWVDGRAAVFRKLGDPDTEDYWRFQPFNRRLDFSPLPLGTRLRIEPRQRARALLRRVDVSRPGVAKALRSLRARLGPRSPDE